MRITYDPRTDALRVEFRHAAHRTTGPAGEGVHAEYDQDGKLVGLEVLRVGELTDGPLSLLLDHAPGAPTAAATPSVAREPLLGRVPVAAWIGLGVACLVSLAVVSGGTRFLGGGARPGTVLLADDMAHPSAGKLPESSASPGGDFSQAYQDGAYVMTLAARSTFDRNPSTGITFPRQVEAPLPDTYADASVSVDAELRDPQNDQYVNLACRSQDSFTEYHLTVSPAAGLFQVIRWKGGLPQSFTGSRPSSAIHRGAERNHLDLRCKGNTITASINGVAVASVSDDALSAGHVSIGVGQAPPGIFPAPITTPGTRVEARFTNLVVTQQ